MNVDLAPLVRGERSDAFRIAGVRVGDLAAAVDRSQLTGAEEAEPGEPRTYSGGKVFRTAADGTLVEVPLSERVDRTLLQGRGWLRVGPIALSVEGGRIDRIYVRGESLASLGIAAQADIERRFGPAAGYEHSLSSREYHYPARHLVIAWDEREGRVEHVRLGGKPWQEPRFGARNLLAELLAAFPNLSAPESLTDSAGIRKLRVAALARAFGIASIDALTSGRFLDGDAAESRRDTLDAIQARGPLPDRKRFSGATSMLFTHLLDYRYDVHRVVRATSGWLECSDPALLGMITTQNQIGRQLEELVADIDTWLCALIDPAGRTFGLRELIAEHGWPDVNLERIEMDEL